MNIVPELLLQETLVLGLHQLAQDPKAINELVRRLDTLQNGTQGDWEKSLRDALIEMLTPESENYVEVIIGYPLGIADLPALSIIEASGGENEAEAVMGDMLHVSYELVQPNNQSRRSQVMGVGEISTIQVGAWAVAPERSLLLRAAAKWAVFNNKGLLDSKGIHELTWQSGGVDNLADELLPRVGYVPMLTYTLKWTFRTTVRDIVPNRVTICPGAFTA